MKKIINYYWLMIIVSIIFLFPQSASAIVMRQISINPTKKYDKLIKITQKTELKRQRAYEEINRRTEALTKLIDRINNMKRVSSQQKSALVAQVQAEITSLNNLYTKIAEDTDLTTLNQDKKSIVNAYRVFVVFMPKITIMAHADSIIETAELMKLKNPNSEALTKITEAINQANSAITKVMSVEPAGWPDNKAELQSARSMVQVARQNLISAWDLIKNKKE